MIKKSRELIASILTIALLFSMVPSTLAAPTIPSAPSGFTYYGTSLSSTTVQGTQATVTSTLATLVAGAMTGPLAVAWAGAVAAALLTGVPTIASTTLYTARFMYYGPTGYNGEWYFVERVYANSARTQQIGPDAKWYGYMYDR